MIRQRVWSTEIYDPSAQLMGIEHIDHCIDSVRQSLMCSADITPLPFQWVEQDERAKEVARVLHTCRAFDPIREWAKNNKVQTFDHSVYVKDELGNGSVWTG